MPLQSVKHAFSQVVDSVPTPFNTHVRQQRLNCSIGGKKKQARNRNCSKQEMSICGDPQKPHSPREKRRKWRRGQHVVHEYLHRPGLKHDEATRDEGKRKRPNQEASFPASVIEN